MKLRPDFVAGNTRLRARQPDLGRLAAEADPFARRRRGRDLLRAVAPAYTDSARNIVDLLLARHDVADVIALLRGAIHGRDPADRVAAVEAVGAVTAVNAADVAHADDGEAAVSRLRSWRLPDADVARRLPALWASFELHRDVEELEVDIVRATHTCWETRLTRHRRLAAPVIDLLAEERDVANVRTVLRIPGREHPQLVPYGRVGPTELLAVRRGDWRPVFGARPEWRALVQPLGPSPVAADVERVLQTSRAAEARVTLRFGNVFGAEIAVAYVLCVEHAGRGWAAAPSAPRDAGVAEVAAKASRGAV